MSGTRKLMDKIIPIDVAEGDDILTRVREVLSRMCTPHGDIRSIDVFMNPVPDQTSGLGLVQMSDESEVTAALNALHGIRFAGCAGFLFRVRWSGRSRGSVS
jgi:hypothetical protein